METWGGLDNQDNSNKDEGKANLALMAPTSSNTKYESTSDSNPNKKARYFLIYL